MLWSFFPRPWSPEESKAALARIDQAFDQRGLGIYAIEVSGTFGGIVGLSIPAFNAPFTPCMEILWRLLPTFGERAMLLRRQRWFLLPIGTILGRSE